MQEKIYSETQLELKKNAKKMVEPWDEDRVDRAFELAFIGHSSQFRQSGEAFISHPIAVAHIVAKLRCDRDTFIAAILHDVVEDTNINLEQLEKEFGQGVTFLVDAVTNISKKSIDTEQDSVKRHVESLRKIILGCTIDLRVAYIKLADRVHNLSTLGARPKERRNRTIKETVDYYAPLARELGISELHRQLNYWAFRFGNIEEYEKVKTIAREYRDSYRRQINRIWYMLDDKLRKADIVSRKVDLPLEMMIIQRIAYSGIHHRLEAQEEFIPPTSMTLIFENISDCYTALGTIHSLWPVVSSRFNDWLKHPLPNGYGAVHTMVQTNDGELVKFKLTTEEMHRCTEWGPLYRFRRELDEKLYQQYRQGNMLGEIIKLEKSIPNTEKFLEYLRLDILRPKVRIFLKNGPVHIPCGATVLDLAFLLDQGSGHRCCGAIVDGENVGIDSVLHEGSMVNLIETESTEPDPSWKFGKSYTTATAKYSIQKELS